MCVGFVSYTNRVRVLLGQVLKSNNLIVVATDCFDFGLQNEEVHSAAVQGGLFH